MGGGIVTMNTAPQTRVLWLKLDCLNPNSQAPIIAAPGNRDWLPGATDCGGRCVATAARSNRLATARGKSKGMSGEPKGR